MDAFLVVHVEVPEHGGVGGVGPWMGLVAAIETWEFHGVADEENGLPTVSLRHELIKSDGPGC